MGLVNNSSTQFNCHQQTTATSFYGLIDANNRLQDYKRLSVLIEAIISK